MPLVTCKVLTPSLCCRAARAAPFPLDHHIWDFHFALAKRGEDGLDHPGVKILPRTFQEDLCGLEGRRPLAVGAVARKDVIGVRYRDDARLNWNLAPPGRVVARPNDCTGGVL